MKVLITGASSGIGKEFAKIFARENYELVLVARRKPLLLNLKKELEQKYNAKVDLIIEDLSDLNSVKRIRKKINNLHTLVNNAGFGDSGPFAKSNYDKNESMINVNITNLTNLTKLFLPDIIANKGKILNVASVAAFQPGPFMSVYFATKSYVLHFSEGLSEELNKKGVSVTCLCPGPTRTEFDKVAGANFKGNIPSAKEVAEYGYKSLMKGKVVAVHDWKFRILVKLNRILPRSVVRKLSSKITRENL